MLLAQRPITAETVQRAQQGTQLLQELLTYAVPPRLSRKELEAGRYAFAKFQSSEYAEEIFVKAGEHRRGRPVKHRQVAPIALEAKQRHPGLSRLQLAQQFCPCGKTRHNAECAERLKRDILRLHALIRHILREYPA